MAKLTEYKDMNPHAKAVVEVIAQARGIDPADINNVWKALARHPSVMGAFAAEMKAAFAPGKLAPSGAPRHLYPFQAVLGKPAWDGRSGA